MAGLRQGTAAEAGLSARHLSRAYSGFAADAVLVAVEAMGVRCEHFEVPVRNVLAVEVGWRGRDAYRRIRRVTPVRAAGTCARGRCEVHSGVRVAVARRG